MLKKSTNESINVKAAFNQGDTAIYIVSAFKAKIDNDKKIYTFIKGSDFHYYKNGDIESGQFDTIMIKN